MPRWPRKIYRLSKDHSVSTCWVKCPKRDGLQQLSCQKLKCCKVNFYYFIQNKEDKTNRKKGRRTGQNSSVSIGTRLRNEWLRKQRVGADRPFALNRAKQQDIGTYSAVLGCVFISVPCSAVYMQSLSVCVCVCLPRLVDTTTLINVCNIHHIILPLGVGGGKE